MSQIDIGCSMMLICTTSTILGINKDVLGMVRMGWVEEAVLEFLSRN